MDTSTVADKSARSTHTLRLQHFDQHNKVFWQLLLCQLNHLVPLLVNLNVQAHIAQTGLCCLLRSTAADQESNEVGLKRLPSPEPHAPLLVNLSLHDT